MVGMLSLFLLALCLDESRSHGRLTEPPSRATAWRYGFDTPKDYDDNQSFCGGLQHLWEVNGGKCGVCGDPWDEEEPRAHEIGGTYGQGVIVRQYESEQVIPVTVELTAAHLGYWELRLCTDAQNSSESCFQHVLKQTNGESRFYPYNISQTYNLEYQLPEDVTCEHCVLAWWYKTGNNWGICLNGSGQLGCGEQEYFRACADVRIEGISWESANNYFPEDWFTKNQMEIRTNTIYNDNDKDEDFEGQKTLIRSYLLKYKTYKQNEHQYNLGAAPAVSADSQPRYVTKSQDYLHEASSGQHKEDWEDNYV